MRLAALILTLALLALAPARAEERILHFNSDVTIEPNGDFLVTETISVLSERDQIDRGIYRDFPMLVREDGVNRRVGFEVLGARRDGNPEPFHVVEEARAIRIYLGDANGYLPSGEHEYVLTYRTDRQLRFFDDHDEVYWNATGTEWIFPIDLATATIRLPGGASALDTAIYTGPHGATERWARLVEPRRGVVRFATTAPLKAREGLTVAVSLPKGLIPAPDKTQRRAWFLRDNLLGLLTLAAAALVFAGYLTVWWHFGRDAPPGLVVYRWEPPDRLSAPMTRTAAQGAAPNTAEGLSLALVELVSLGLLKMTQHGNIATMTRSKTATPDDLSPDLRLVLDRIASQKDHELTINRANGTTIEQLQNDLHDRLSQMLKGARLSRRNGWWVFLALVINLPLLVYLPLQAPFSLRPTLLSLIPVSVLLILTLRRLFWDGREGPGIAGWVGGVIAIAVLLPLTILLVTLHLNQGGTLMMPAAMVSLLVVNMVFLPILGRVTPAGRRALDQITGLRDYIEIAEKDRLNLHGVPDMSVPHFERILPYAMALELESAWVRRFNTWLADARPEGEIISESTFGMRIEYGQRSASLKWDGSGNGQASLQRQLALSLTAALPVAKASASGFSSGGGGPSGSSSGGSSGGGGGGGGGGGW